MNIYPPIPVGIQVLVLSTQLFGILANIFFLYILLRYHRGWNPGKMLLIVFSAAALAFLMCVFFPLVVVVSTGRDLTPAQCTMPVLINHGASCALPLSLGVAAHLRWKTVQAAMRNTQAPNAKRYLYFMIGFIVALIVLANATANGVPFEWVGPLMLCIRPVPIYSAVLTITVFAGAPYIIYCYRKLLVAILNNASNDNEIARAIYILLVFFYVTYLPLFVAATLDFGAEAVTVPATGYQILAWFNQSHTALSPVVSIMTIPRYRSIAVDLLKCQTVRMKLSTKGLSADSVGTAKKSARSHRRNSTTASASVKVVVPPNTENKNNPAQPPDTPKHSSAESVVPV